MPQRSTLDFCGAAGVLRAECPKRAYRRGRFGVRPGSLFRAATISRWASDDLRHPLSMRITDHVWDLAELLA